MTALVSGNELPIPPPWLSTCPPQAWKISMMMRLFFQGLLEETARKRLQGNQHPQIHDRVSWICRFGTSYVEGQMMSNVTGKAIFLDQENSSPRISSRDVLDALAEHGQLSATKRIWP